jgi:hypothetical protein
MAYIYDSHGNTDLPGERTNPTISINDREHHFATSSGAKTLALDYQ